MNNKIAEVFGVDVFDDVTMKERLPEETYNALHSVIENRTEMSKEVANVVANEMMEWAIERGATHYTHWFQPLTGITAGKHDSFIEPMPGGQMKLAFSGKELIKGEADASSFPSGGLRATFEARGYTAWDCTSPAFLREDAAGVTLCIPTVFCSYTGETLDKKTPLLKSLDSLSKQAVRIVHLFGNEDVKKVDVSVGPEQEYFLVDHEKYMQRDDLIYTGRTLFGAPAPKGQELEDHYYGSIKERVAAYMKDLNVELWKLGIYAKTQHNEVAPAQHELAPIYTSANIATDHNQLTMDTMQKVAKRHGLECLLHEKPYAGVNGSGKHDNWSIVTDTGINLLNPGKNPNENLLFMLVLTAIIEAVDKHASLLRLSASNPGNDHRLGADEAPPAIISIFLGEQLEDVVAQFIENGEATHLLKGEKMSVGVKSVPRISRDATDRNRTSPFAFTGNKFEFRSVGSSMSIAEANTVLNSIVAETFMEFADRLEKSENFDKDVHDLIKESLTKHQRVLFNGNGYGEEWVEEAARRGLPNIKSFVEAIEVFTSKESVELFEKLGIYSEAELKSRAEIDYEYYAKVINIEAKTMIDMANRKYIPSIIRYVSELAKSVNQVERASNEATPNTQRGLLLEVQGLLDEAEAAVEELSKKVFEAAKKTDTKEKALFFKFDVYPAMEALRTPIDTLETMVDARFWPVPTYGELQFEV